MKLSDLGTPGICDTSRMQLYPSIDPPITIAKYMVNEAPIQYDGEQDSGHEDGDAAGTNMHREMAPFNNYKIKGYHWMWGRDPDGALTHVLVDVTKDETIAFIKSFHHPAFYTTDGEKKEAFELDRAWIHDSARGKGLVYEMIMTLHQMGFSIIGGDNESTPARAMMNKIEAKLKSHNVVMRYYNIETGKYLDDGQPTNLPHIRRVFEQIYRPKMTNTVLYENLYWDGELWNQLHSGRWVGEEHFYGKMDVTTTTAEDHGRIEAKWTVNDQLYTASLTTPDVPIVK